MIQAKPLSPVLKLLVAQSFLQLKNKHHQFAQFVFDLLMAKKKKKLVYSIFLLLIPVCPQFGGLPSESHRECGDFKLYLLVSLSSLRLRTRSTCTCCFPTIASEAIRIPGSATS